MGSIRKTEIFLTGIYFLISGACFAQSESPPVTSSSIRILNFENVTTLENDGVRMECRVTQSPDTKIILGKLNECSEPTNLFRRRYSEWCVQSYNTTTCKIDVDVVQSSDAGLYRCCVFNKSNSNLLAESQAFLQVESKPVIATNWTVSVTTTVIGGKVNLTCAAAANPPPSIEWRTPTGDSAVPGSALTIFERGNMSILQVIVSDRSYFGNYTCEAANRWGFARTNYTVALAGEPLALLSVNFSNLTANTITFEFQPSPNDGRLPISEFVVDYRQEGEDSADDFTAESWPADSNLQSLRNLRPGATYYFRFASANSEGRSQWFPSEGGQRMTMPPASVPSAPTIIGDQDTRKPITSSAFYNLKWIVPADNGNPITSFLIDFYKVRQDASGSVTKIGPAVADRFLHVNHTQYELLLQPLDQDSLYRIEVRATNGIGSSQPGNITIRTGGGGFCAQAGARYFQDRCFKVIDGIATFLSAKEECTSTGGYLASVPDDSTHTFIQHLIMNSRIFARDGYWIGVQHQNGQLVSVKNDGQSVSFTAWLSFEPSHISTFPCVAYALKRGRLGWSNLDCTKARPYICEYTGTAGRDNASITNHTIPDLPSESQNDSDCPVGTTRFRNRCYYFSHTHAPQAVALTACRQSNGRLATIRNEAVSDFIAQQLLKRPGQPDYWIGHMLNGPLGAIRPIQYEQTLGGSVSYVNWAPGEPSYASALPCVAYRLFWDSKYRWYNFDCDEDKAFICEYEASGNYTDTEPEDLITTPFPRTGDAGCPNGSLIIRNRCYGVGNTRASFDEARGMCAQRGGDLASIPDQSTHASVQSLILSAMSTDDYSDFWIGLKYQNSVLTRLSTTDTGSFTAWAPFEPSWTHVYPCVAYRSKPSGSMWYNLDCSRPRRFICELPVNASVIGLSKTPVVFSAAETGTSVSTTSVSPTVTTEENSDPTACPAGAAAFRSRCFLISSFVREFDEAQSTCQGGGGHLAVVEDSATNVFLRNLIKNNVKDRGPDFWIGAKFINDQLMIIKPEGNVPAVYRAWTPGEPSSTTSLLCIAYHYTSTLELYGWGNWGCTVDRRFICEYPAEGTANSTNAPSTPKGCAKDSHHFHGKCYSLTPNKAGFDEAGRICNSSGAILPSIKDKYQQLFLQKIFMLSGNTSNFFWLGLRFQTGSISPVNVNDGSPVDYFDWASGEPSYTYEHPCIAASMEGHWYSMPCSVQLNFICESNAKDLSGIQNNTNEENLIAADLGTARQIDRITESASSHTSISPITFAICLLIAAIAGALVVLTWFVVRRRYSQRYRHRREEENLIRNSITLHDGNAHL